MSTRFQTAVPLATGGVARVVKAFDPVLGREVALKFLKQDDPLHVARLEREARVLSRVRHENLCRVYEVGRWEGKPYLSMQLVEGVTVDCVVERTSIEERVRILQRVALAVHAAHEAGVLHRDLKPSNIMVEEERSGGFKPYVLDFGLASEEDVPALTRSGQVVGTPAYMSPEQARGATSELDRRSDVYALGAVLFELLAGRPPFLGDSSVDILVQVVERPPPLLRRLDPELAVDLEVIVGKCLEKEPAQRYPTARALAEEFGRFLAAEPIQARPLGWGGRLARRARRHRPTAILLATSLALLLTLLGLFVRERRQAREVAEVAQRFGREVERIDAIARHSHTLPLHDVRRERRMIRQRLERLRAESEGLQRRTAWVGEYALGRGYLALQEPHAARHHLERAWNRGYRDSEVAYGLGMVLGMLYGEELLAAHRVESPELRATQLRLAAESYRDPAIRFLRQSEASALEAPEYVAGRIALWDGRAEEALRNADAAFVKVPWLYEAKLLAGDVHFTTGQQLYFDGDHDAAADSYRRAEGEYRVAATIGESDPLCYLGLCRAAAQLMTLEVQVGGDDVEAHRDEAFVACRDARAADPGSAAPHVEEARVWGLWAQYLWFYRSQDLTDAAREELASALRATELEPENWQAHEELGNAYGDLSVSHRNRGEDPRGDLDAATASYRRALELHPNYLAARLSLGNAHLGRGIYDYEHGADPRPSLAAAVEAYEQVERLQPDSYAALNNQSFATLHLALFASERGEDCVHLFTSAIALAERASARANRVAFPLALVGLAHREWGRDLLLRDGDPELHLTAARASLERAIEANAEIPDFHLDLAAVHLLRSRAALERGTAAAAPLADARRVLEEVQAMRPQESDLNLHLGELELLVGREAMAAERSPSPALERAASRLAAAIEQKPGVAKSYVRLAETEWWRARTSESEAAARRRAAAGLTAAERALQIHPTLAEAMALRGALELEMARRSAPPARGEGAGRAVRAFVAALEINRRLERTFAAALAEARRLSTQTEPVSTSEATQRQGGKWRDG